MTSKVNSYSDGVGTVVMSFDGKEHTMDSKALESLASQIIAGEMSSDAAQALCDAHERSRRRPPMILAWDTAWVDDEPLSLPVYNRDVVHPAARAVVDDPPQSEAADEVSILGVWEDRSEGSDGPEVPVAAGRVYEEAPANTRLTLKNRDGDVVAQFETSATARERWGTNYVVGSAVRPANSRYEEQARQWERESFLDFRAPVVKAQPGDEERGYRLDPRRTMGPAELEREYGPKREVEVQDVVRDELGDAVSTPGHGFNFVTKTETRQGSVGWLYERLTKLVNGRAAGLPWMDKRTYKWFRESERRYELRKRQRAAVIRLIRQLGQDPHEPKIAAWVQDRGYEAAMLSLARRAAREGVSA